ncbi:hypothetical protein FBU30_009280 [Linnemannia zychae]|nr:hypothetical protein FBU30_009280 [Linnemannia zychae]
MPVATHTHQHTSTRRQSHLLLANNNCTTNTDLLSSHQDLSPSSNNATDFCHKNSRDENGHIAFTNNTTTTRNISSGSGSSSGSTIMKTDRKVDPISSVKTTSRRHSTATSTSSANDSNAAISATKGPTSKKRKAANNDINDHLTNSISKQRRTSHHFSDDAASQTTESFVATQKQQAGDHKAGEGEEYVIAVSSGRKKKRVLVSPVPVPVQTTRPSNQQQKDIDHDTDMNSSSDVDVVSVDEAMPKKKAKSSRSRRAAISSTVVSMDSKSPPKTAVPSSLSASKGKASKRNADNTVNTTSTTTTVVVEAIEAESGKSENVNNNINENPTPPKSQPLVVKKSRRSSAKSTRSKGATSTTPATPPSLDDNTASVPILPAPVDNKVGSSPPSTPVTLGSNSDTTPPQKRVLPTRSGILRDKNTIPIELSLLEPPPVPSGEYIVYLANQQTFQHTVLDPKRVPPASYGGIDVATTTESSLSSTTAVATTIQPTLTSVPPPSSTTHIEVPIFKLCSISQFLQEEKKRKMLLLTKALAKAEADAAAEAKALMSSNTPSTLVTPRAVSTRQKHKAIVNNQQVSVQTAVPSCFSSSSTNTKKATITNTTVGKIEGTVGGSGVGSGTNMVQEESLSDEVYEKRHRKQEMAEKKLKNREKEKLRHAMYQQQLVVEKLRHMDVNRLMPVSAFRTLQKTVELEQQLKEASSHSDDTNHHHSNALSLTAAKMVQEEYYRRLLLEAEDNLKRYEQLGLADSANVSSTPAYTPFSRTKNRLLSMTTSSDQSSPSKNTEVSSDRKDKPIHISNDSSPSETRRKRHKTTDSHAEDIQDSVFQQRHRHRVSASPGSSIPSARKSQPKISASATKPVIATSDIAAAAELPRQPKPITTFIKPGSIHASGSRKSYRVSLAFGEKVPVLDRIDFELPLDLFGDIIRERFGDSEPMLHPKKGVSQKARNQSVRSRFTTGELLGKSTVSRPTGNSTKDPQSVETDTSSETSSSSSSVLLPVSLPS